MRSGRPSPFTSDTAIQKGLVDTFRVASVKKPPRPSLVSTDMEFDRRLATARSTWPAPFRFVAPVTKSGSRPTPNVAVRMKSRPLDVNVRLPALARPESGILVIFAPLPENEPENVPFKVTF